MRQGDDPRRMSTEELWAAYDAIRGGAGTTVTTYVLELHRREAQAQTDELRRIAEALEQNTRASGDRMERMTHQMLWLTRANVVIAVVAAAAAVAALAGVHLRILGARNCGNAPSGVRVARRTHHRCPE
jgi:hypothetical protein